MYALFSRFNAYSYVDVMFSVGMIEPYKSRERYNERSARVPY